VSVFSNTTPFIALASIDQLALLPQLFGGVHVAQSVIDERLGRRVAEYLGLNVTGTLSVLAKAKSLGLIPSFHEATHAMRRQDIHYNTSLIARLANHLGETP
jgi:predicted nucleic acid-binding protein